ncbi:MAG: amino-acid N-acetyltransferase [Verrucomicrobiales bacterium]|nr:amino-acid N-acetyltransferase [Verrucomicrobiales bacterium]
MIEKFGDLRGILQYVPQFRGRVFVVAVDGAVLAGVNYANILLDLAVLHSLNVKVVLVFGASAQVERLAEQRGIEASDFEGIGRTDPATLQLSIDAITRMTSDLMQDLTRLGLKTATSNVLMARSAGVVGGLDLEATGKVDLVSVEGLQAFMDQGMVPLVAPLGYDGRGNTFRLNSDECAEEIGVALEAAKILYLSRDGLGVVPRQLPVEEAEDLAEGAEVFSEGYRSKLTHGARACRRGVSRAHIIDGSVNEGLLRELFSNEGIATMVYVDTYRRIRLAVAGDVAEIVSLTGAGVADGELVRRTRREVAERIGDYSVLVIDENVVGTVAVHLDDTGSAAELACLYIKETHEGKGYGSQLLRFAEKRAADLGAETLVALTTRASGFFTDHGGYREGGVEDLPEARRVKLQVSGRNSKVMVKGL